MPLNVSVHTDAILGSLREAPLAFRGVLFSILELNTTPKNVLRISAVLSYVMLILILVVGFTVMSVNKSNSSSVFPIVSNSPIYGMHAYSGTKYLLAIVSVFLVVKYVVLWARISKLYKTNVFEPPSKLALVIKNIWVVIEAPVYFCLFQWVILPAFIYKSANNELCPIAFDYYCISLTESSASHVACFFLCLIFRVIVSVVLIVELCIKNLLYVVTNSSLFTSCVLPLVILIGAFSLFIIRFVTHSPLVFDIVRFFIVMTLSIDTIIKIPLKSKAAIIVMGGALGFVGFHSVVYIILDSNFRAPNLINSLLAGAIVEDYRSINMSVSPKGLRLVHESFQFWSLHKLVKSPWVIGLFPFYGILVGIFLADIRLGFEIERINIHISVRRGMLLLNRMWKVKLGKGTSNTGAESEMDGEFRVNSDGGELDGSSGQYESNLEDGNSMGIQRQDNGNNIDGGYMISSGYYDNDGSGNVPPKGGEISDASRIRENENGRRNKRPMDFMVGSSSDFYSNSDNMESSIPPAFKTSVNVPKLRGVGLRKNKSNSPTDLSLSLSSSNSEGSKTESYCGGHKDTFAYPKLYRETIDENTFKNHIDPFYRATYTHAFVPLAVEFLQFMNTRALKNFAATFLYEESSMIMLQMFEILIKTRGKRANTSYYVKDGDSVTLETFSEYLYLTSQGKNTGILKVTQNEGQDSYSEVCSSQFLDEPIKVVKTTTEEVIEDIPVSAYARTESSYLPYNRLIPISNINVVYELDRRTINHKLEKRKQTVSTLIKYELEASGTNGKNKLRRLHRMAKGIMPETTKWKKLFNNNFLYHGPPVINLHVITGLYTSRTFSTLASFIVYTAWFMKEKVLVLSSFSRFSSSLHCYKLIKTTKDSRVYRTIISFGKDHSSKSNLDNINPNNQIVITGRHSDSVLTTSSSYNSTFFGIGLPRRGARRNDETNSGDRSLSSSETREDARAHRGDVGYSTQPSSVLGTTIPTDEAAGMSAENRRDYSQFNCNGFSGSSSSSYSYSKLPSRSTRQRTPENPVRMEPVQHIPTSLYEKMLFDIGPRTSQMQIGNVMSSLSHIGRELVHICNLLESECPSDATKFAIFTVLESQNSVTREVISERYKRLEKSTNIFNFNVRSSTKKSLFEFSILSRYINNIRYDFVPDLIRQLLYAMWFNSNYIDPIQMKLLNINKRKYSRQVFKILFLLQLCYPKPKICKSLIDKGTKDDYAPMLDILSNPQTYNYHKNSRSIFDFKKTIVLLGDRNYSDIAFSSKISQEKQRYLFDEKRLDYSLIKRKRKIFIYLYKTIFVVMAIIFTLVFTKPFIDVMASVKILIRYMVKNGIILFYLSNIEYLFFEYHKLIGGKIVGDSVRTKANIVSILDTLQKSYDILQYWEDVLRTRGSGETNIGNYNYTVDRIRRNIVSINNIVKSVSSVRLDSLDDTSYEETMTKFKEFREDMNDDTSKIFNVFFEYSKILPYKDIVIFLTIISTLFFFLIPFATGYPDTFVITKVILKYIRLLKFKRKTPIKRRKYELQLLLTAIGHDKTPKKKKEQLEKQQLDYGSIFERLKNRFAKSEDSKDHKVEKSKQVGGNTSDYVPKEILVSHALPNSLQTIHETENGEGVYRQSFYGRTLQSYTRRNNLGYKENSSLYTIPSLVDGVPGFAHGPQTTTGGSTPISTPRVDIGYQIHGRDGSTTSSNSEESENSSSVCRRCCPGSRCHCHCNLREKTKLSTLVVFGIAFLVLSAICLYLFNISLESKRIFLNAVNDSIVTSEELAELRQASNTYVLSPSLFVWTGNKQYLEAYKRLRNLKWYRHMKRWLKVNDAAVVDIDTLGIELDRLALVGCAVHSINCDIYKPDNTEYNDEEIYSVLSKTKPFRRGFFMKYTKKLLDSSEYDPNDFYGQSGYVGTNDEVGPGKRVLYILNDMFMPPITRSYASLCALVLMAEKYVTYSNIIENAAYSIYNEIGDSGKTRNHVQMAAIPYYSIDQLMSDYSLLPDYGRFWFEQSNKFKEIFPTKPYKDEFPTYKLSSQYNYNRQSNYTVNAITSPIVYSNNNPAVENVGLLHNYRYFDIEEEVLAPLAKKVNEIDFSNSEMRGYNPTEYEGVIVFLIFLIIISAAMTIFFGRKEKYAKFTILVFSVAIAIVIITYIYYMSVKRHNCVRYKTFNYVRLFYLIKVCSQVLLDDSAIFTTPYLNIKNSVSWHFTHFHSVDSSEFLNIYSDIIKTICPDIPKMREMEELTGEPQLLPPGIVLNGELADEVSNFDVYKRLCPSFFMPSYRKSEDLFFHDFGNIPTGTVKNSFNYLFSTGLTKLIVQGVLPVITSDGYATFHINKAGGTGYSTLRTDMGEVMNVYAGSIATGSPTNLFPAIELYMGDNLKEAGLMDRQVLGVYSKIHKIASSMASNMSTVMMGEKIYYMNNHHNWFSDLYLKQEGSIFISVGNPAREKDNATTITQETKITIPHVKDITTDTQQPVSMIPLLNRRSQPSGDDKQTQIQTSRQYLLAQFDQLKGLGYSAVDESSFWSPEGADLEKVLTSFQKNYRIIYPLKYDALYIKDDYPFLEDEEEEVELVREGMLDVAYTFKALRFVLSDDFFGDFFKMSSTANQLESVLNRGLQKVVAESSFSAELIRTLINIFGYLVLFLSFLGFLSLMNSVITFSVKKIKMSIEWRQRGVGEYFKHLPKTLLFRYSHRFCGLPITACICVLLFLAAGIVFSKAIPSHLSPPIAEHNAVIQLSVYVVRLRSNLIEYITEGFNSEDIEETRRLVLVIRDVATAVFYGYDVTYVNLDQADKSLMRRVKWHTTPNTISDLYEEFEAKVPVSPYIVPSDMLLPNIKDFKGLLYRKYRGPQSTRISPYKFTILGSDCLINQISCAANSLELVNLGIIRQKDIQPLGSIQNIDDYDLGVDGDIYRNNNLCAEIYRRSNIAPYHGLAELIRRDTHMALRILDLLESNQETKNEEEHENNRKRILSSLNLMSLYDLHARSGFLLLLNNIEKELIPEVDFFRTAGIVTIAIVYVVLFILFVVNPWGQIQQSINSIKKHFVNASTKGASSPARECSRALRDLL